MKTKDRLGKCPWCCKECPREIMLSVSTGTYCGLDCAFDSLILRAKGINEEMNNLVTNKYKKMVKNDTTKAISKL